MASRNERVICLGNGTSRQNVDLDKLSLYFTMYGCNALYRDWTPDVLTAVDHGIMHEIYHSGYGYTNTCYFRDWNKLPGDIYNTMLYSNVSEEDKEAIKKWDVIRENKRTDETEFVLHGAQLKGIVDVLKKTGKIEKKNINHNSICISWTKKDKVLNLKEVMVDNGGRPHDYGWSAGPTSGYIASRKENPKEIYLVGHDLYSPHNKVNNIYAGSQYYVMKEQHPTPCVNWIRQWRDLMTWRPDITFYKVNEFNDSRDKTNAPIKEWEHLTNLKYIDHIALDNLCQM